MSRPAWEASIYPAKFFWEASIYSAKVFGKSGTGGWHHAAPKAPVDGVWVLGFVQSRGIDVKFGMKFCLERDWGSQHRLPVPPASRLPFSVGDAEARLPPAGFLKFYLMRRVGYDSPSAVKVNAIVSLRLCSFL